MKKRNTMRPFAPTYETLREAMTDSGLASLGDAFINFVCSLALSSKKRKPLGTKVKGSLLAEALRRAGLRKHLPSSLGSHELADAAEALLVYAWLHNHLQLEECASIIENNDDQIDGLKQLLQTARDRTMLS